MRSFICLIGVLGTTAIISACSTTQENPNYQFSSRYEGPQQATVQTASTAPSVTSVGYESTTTPNGYASGAYSAETGLPDTVISDTVISEPMLAGAPTDLDYADQDMIGTPGYMAVSGFAADVPQSGETRLEAPVMVTAGATQIDYDYGQNIIMTEADVAGATPQSDVRTFGTYGNNYAEHTVTDGDTVYSLARNSCTSVDAIRQANALDAAYSISIGQTLSIPGGC